MYHAMNENGEELAIKVYKTSILVFKDRERYVSGDYRFRRGYSKSNPRKMVAMWSEKERRNLTRYCESVDRSEIMHIDCMMLALPSPRLLCRLRMSS